MYEVNIAIKEGYHVLIASGSPRLTNGPGGTVKFFDVNYFVLHIMDEGGVVGIVTPGRNA